MAKQSDRGKKLFALPAGYTCCMGQKPKFQFGISTAAAAIAAIAMVLGAARVHFALGILAVGVILGLFSSLLDGRRHDVALSVALALVALAAFVLMILNVR